jgi:putative intracellular protease/amidase
MTRTKPKTAQTKPGLVAVVTYDGLCTFEFGIAVEVFGLPRPEFDFPWYEFAVVSAEGRRSRAMGGIVVEASGGLDLLDTARTIIVPGWRDRLEHPPERLLKAISRASARGARCLSICSGVFVLAAAGLLDGKRATTHWRHMPDLKRLFPSVEVEEDTLYVDEGSVITSVSARHAFGSARLRQQDCEQCCASLGDAAASRRRTSSVCLGARAGATGQDHRRGHGLGALKALRANRNRGNGETRCHERADFLTAVPGEHQHEPNRMAATRAHVSRTGIAGNRETLIG